MQHGVPRRKCGLDAGHCMPVVHHETASSFKFFMCALRASTSSPFCMIAELLALGKAVFGRREMPNMCLHYYATHSCGEPRFFPAEGIYCGAHSDCLVVVVNVRPPSPARGLPAWRWSDRAAQGAIGGVQDLTLLGVKFAPLRPQGAFKRPPRADG